MSCLARPDSCQERVKLFCSFVGRFFVRSPLSSALVRIEPTSSYGRPVATRMVRLLSEEKFKQSRCAIALEHTTNCQKASF